MLDTSSRLAITERFTVLSISISISIAKSPAFVLVFGSNREGQAGVGCSDDSDCIYSPMPIHSDDSVTTLKFLMFI